MVLLKLTYRTTEKPELGDLSSLLYDFELLYDYLIVSTMEDYSSYTFPQNFWYRYGRPLLKEDKASIEHVSYGSSLVVVIAVSSWVLAKIMQPLVQITGDIADWSANRRKASAEAATAQLKEIEKLADIEYKQIRNRRAELLAEKTEYETGIRRIQFEELEQQREIKQRNTLKQIQKRLSRNPYQLEDIAMQQEKDEKENPQDSR